MIEERDLVDRIQEAKDIIGDDAISIIAEHLGITVEDGRASCPFHQDDTPSFIWNPKLKYFKCFSCSRVYSILDYFVDITGSTKEAINELFKMAHMEYDTYSYKPFEGDRIDWFKDYKYPHPEKEPTEDNVIKYLGYRGISKNTIEYAGIKEDEYGNIAFEYRDLDNELLAVKYKPSRKVKNGEPKMWFQKDASTVPILWNVKKLDFTKPLVISEGEIDALSIIESGYNNVCSIPNGAGSISWIEFNFDFLENFNSIILWFDNDKAGEEGLKKTASRLGEYRCKIVKPKIDDEDKVEEYYSSHGRMGVRKTDANNILITCGKERVIDLINRAEEVPVKNLKYLMDCEVLDLKDVEKFTTGLQSLDNILYGSLMSTLTIYTGVAGSGKSTLCNLTSVIAPIETGHKVFVFSGELSEGQLLSWIMSPLAGINNTVVWDNDGGRKGFSTTAEAEQAIRDYYHNDIIVYSSSDELETSDDDLIKAMEVAYKKYGCDVFLVDNLLCIPMEANGNESKWDAQKKFIIKLMNFTTQYNVSTNLVVHPRKPSGDEDGDLGIYSLHGASELSNLCHRLISVKRLKEDEDGYSMEVNIIKDRPSQAAGQRCRLMYDYCTRKIYSTNEELKHEFNWELNFNHNYTGRIKENLIVNRPDVLDTIPKINTFNPETDCDQY